MNHVKFCDIQGLSLLTRMSNLVKRMLCKGLTSERHSNCCLLTGVHIHCFAEAEGYGVPPAFERYLAQPTQAPPIGVYPASELSSRELLVCTAIQNYAG